MTATRSARALLFDDAGRLVLIKRVRPGLTPYWTTPGGRVEPSDAHPTQQHILLARLVTIDARLRPRTHRRSHPRPHPPTPASTPSTCARLS